MKKRNKRSTSKPTRINANAAKTALQPSDVLAMFASSHKPLGWPELRERTGAQSAADADRLRRVLRGLCHAGELYLDEHGNYHSAQHPGEIEGTVVAGERGSLAVRTEKKGADERWPIRFTREFRIRPDDTVKARIVEGQAVVTQVMQRAQRKIVGRLVTSQGRAYVISESPDYSGRVYLDREKQIGADDGDSVAVEIVGEEGQGLTGRIAEVVAPRDDLHVASTTLLRAYDVPTDWPHGIDDEVGNLPERVDVVLEGGRIDVRDLPLVTIDGEDARDFDDAVYCEARRGGGWRLVVAIADVGHYVPVGGALDKSAESRGNSVYLPDRVVPMLPEALSNDLCSLRPHVPRLCLVCDMSISAQGRVSGYRFYEGLMHSAARLTYTQVAAFLNGGTLDVSAVVVESLRELHAVFRALLAAREARGALDFESREQKLVLENGLLERIVPVARNEAHRLIEEAMIAANVCAARFIEKPRFADGTGGRRALYRIHEGPTPEKWEQLRQTLVFAGIRVGATTPTPAELKRVVDLLGDRSDRWLFESLVLRSMSQAVYSPNNTGHFGLALPKYMHFTSPIRRYADLVVHRVIKAMLAEREPSHQEMGPLADVGAHISATERRADEVSREVGNWLKCEYAARFVGDTFAGTVVGITDFGLFVELAGVYLQGLVHVSNLGEDFFRYHPTRLSLIGERTGKRFTLGDSLDVVLADVDPEGRKIDLLLPNRTRGRRKPDNKRRGRR